MAQAMAQDIGRIRTSYNDARDAERAVTTEAFETHVRRDNPMAFYKVDKLLGQGSFGAVYECIENATGKRYALKKINTRSKSCKPEMLQREIATMVKCHHPFLVEIKEVFRDEREMNIVMQLVAQPGRDVEPDLFSWLTNPAGKGLGMDRQATEEQVAFIIKSVSEAILYLNDEMGCIHRDLKTENILVGPEGIDALKVTDFGLARLGVDSEDSDFVATFAAGTP